MGDADSTPGIRNRTVFFSGLKDCFMAPGWGVFAAMVGFGSVAGEAGKSLWRSLVIMYGLWSTPAQIAFVELGAGEIAAWTLIVAVTVANLRMIPITLASIPLIRGRSRTTLWHYWLAQLNSVCAFVQLTDAANRIKDADQLARYFHGFCVGTLVLGTLGTTLGHTLANQLPAQGVRGLIFITPLYVLLLIGRSRDSMMLGAAVLGGIIVPVMHAWSSDWGVIVGGFAAGTIAFALFEPRRAK